MAAKALRSLQAPGRPLDMLIRSRLRPKMVERLIGVFARAAHPQVVGRASAAETFPNLHVVDSGRVLRFQLRVALKSVCAQVPICLADPNPREGRGLQLEKVRLWGNSIGPRVTHMKPILTAATLAAGFGLATTSAGAQYDVGYEIARGVINGIILGGRVGPDFYGFVPTNIESRVMASTPGQTPARRRPGYARLLMHSAVPRPGG
jgi:hypothetical protein